LVSQSPWTHATTLENGLLTWIAVWPVSMLVPAILMPLLGPNSPQGLSAGLIAAGIVVIRIWVAMPLLVSRAPLASPMNEGANQTGTCLENPQRRELHYA
jgi:hypothetical protein